MKINRIISLSLVPLLCFFSGCNKNQSTDIPNEQTEYIPQIFTEKALNAVKTETVYANLDASGNIIGLNVTDWIHTDKGGVYVDDISNLKNIENIKNEIQPIYENGIIRWHMPDTDLYYKGKADKAPPISFEISYFLNGEEISPDDIAGKSGNVTIKINIKNHAIKIVKKNGVEHKLYLPVIAVGGMIMPENVFSSVSVKNAQSLSDGTKQLVLFTSMPGLSDSLGFIKENIGDIGNLIASEEITVNAVAKNFRLDNMYFAVLPVASLNLDFAMPETVSDVKNALTALKSVQNALNKIDPDRFILSFLSDEAKVDSLLDAARDAADLYNKNQNLIRLLGKYSTPENSAAIEKLLDTLKDPNIQAMISIISDPAVQSFISGLPEFTEALGDVTPIIEELQKDMSSPAVQAEISALPETVDRLSEITGVLSENEKEINALLSLLDNNGTDTLSSLFESINPDDFNDLENKYGGLVEDSDLLVLLCEEWLKFGTEYGIFTDSAEGMSTSLMFIYKTERIVDNG